MIAERLAEIQQEMREAEALDRLRYPEMFTQPITSEIPWSDIEQDGKRDCGTQRIGLPVRHSGKPVVSQGTGQRDKVSAA